MQYTQLERLVRSSSLLDEEEKKYILKLLNKDPGAHFSNKSEKQAYSNIQDVREYFDVSGDSDSAITDLKFYISGRVNSGAGKSANPK